MPKEVLAMILPSTRIYKEKMISIRIKRKFKIPLDDVFLEKLRVQF